MIPTTKTEAIRDPRLLRVLIYGAPKIGKTSVCAAIGDTALILDCDAGGASYTDAWRVPIGTWGELLAALKDLADRQAKGKVPFRTFVIDTVDRAWQMCREHVCMQYKVRHESDDPGYGRVWDAVKQEFMRVIGRMSAMGWGIWLTSHSDLKEVKIGNVKRQVTTMSLPSKAARLCGLFSDVIAYIDLTETGERVMFLEPADSLECGNRLGLRSFTYDNPEEAIRLLLAQAIPQAKPANVKKEEEQNGRPNTESA